jgi:hypothetical protein
VACVCELDVANQMRRQCCGDLALVLNRRDRIVCAAEDQDRTRGSREAGQQVHMRQSVSANS